MSLSGDIAKKSAEILLRNLFYRAEILLRDLFLQSLSKDFETDLAKRPLIRSFYRERAKRPQRPLVEILRRDIA